MRKLCHRDVKYLAYDHRAVKQQKWVSNPGYLVPESVLKTILLGYDWPLPLYLDGRMGLGGRPKPKVQACTEGMIKGGQ